MSKADFTFYDVPGSVEYVIPAQACDPYGGELAPNPLFARSGLQDTLTDSFPDATIALRSSVGSIDPAYGYMVQSYTYDDKSAPDLWCGRIDARVQYAEMPSEQDAQGMLLAAIMNHDIHLSGQESPKIHVLNNGGGFLYLTNNDGNPTHITDTYLAMTSFRAYRWNEGPTRTSRQGKTDEAKLPPVWTPQRAPVRALCSVRVTLINPDVATVE